MSGDVIVTVTLNAALHVAYTVSGMGGSDGSEEIVPVSRPVYRAGGRGVTVARVLRAFGHDVLAAGLVGGASGELIVQDLARSGVPTAFTLIRGESRRFFRYTGLLEAGVPGGLGGVVPPGANTARFSEPGPYITTEELGRFAADYRRLLAGAAAVVLCGSLPDGLDADTYGSLVTYAVEAGVPVILDAGGEELKYAVGHGPDLVVADVGAGQEDPGELGAALVRLGASAAAVAAGGVVSAVTASGKWSAHVEAAGAAGPGPAAAPARGALVAGLVPGQLLGWSWPDRLRHALALAAGGAGTWTREPGDAVERDRVDLAAYERLLDAVRVEAVRVEAVRARPGRAKEGRAGLPVPDNPKSNSTITGSVLRSGLGSLPVRRIPGPRPRSASATRPFLASHRMECSVFYWRIWLGGAASAAILTAGVAAPAFAAPRAGTPNPLSGITQGHSGSQAGGVFCALPSLPVSVGVTAAASAIGESCGSAQASGTSESSVNGQQGPFVAKPAGQDSGQDSGQGNGQSNGPARTASTPQSALSSQASGAPSALPGLNSVSGVIPDLSAPDLGSVTGPVSGGAGNLTGGGQNGGPATGPLP